MDTQRAASGPAEPGLYDPGWLRRSYRRCLWDGGERRGQAEFCSQFCEESYDAWTTIQMRLDEEREGVFEEGASRTDPSRGQPTGDGAISTSDPSSNA